jgi:hypothetical protein
MRVGTLEQVGLLGGVLEEDDGGAYVMLAHQKISPFPAAKTETFTPAFLLMNFRNRSCGTCSI